MNNTKNNLRNVFLNKRKSLNNNEVIVKSSLIVNTLINMNEFKNANIIMCYVNNNNEVITKDFIRHCLKIKKKVAVPYVVQCQKLNIIKGIEIKNIQELSPGYCGIYEPNSVEYEIKPYEFDLIVVPGIVFDINRFRIGYGKGMYDRFLKRVNNNCKKVGLAYDFQIIESIPAEEHDIQVDKIITESKIL